MGTIFDELRKSQVPKEKITGKLWVTLLIEFDIAGNAKILRSFSKPAKESSIKFIKKEKAKPINLGINNTDKKEEPLF